MAAFKSGGGVLCIAALQLIVGLSLLGVFEVRSRGYQTTC